MPRGQIVEQHWADSMESKDMFIIQSHLSTFTRGGDVSSQRMESFTFWTKSVRMERGLGHISSFAPRSHHFPACPSVRATAS